MATDWTRTRSLNLLTTRANPNFPALDAIHPTWRGRTQKSRPRAAGPFWFRIILELKRGTTAKDFAAGVWGKGLAPRGTRNWLRVPSVYRNPPIGLENLQFCTALITIEFFDKLRTLRFLFDVVERYQIGLPSIGTSGASVTPPINPDNSGSRGMVVVGVIDDGIAFAHERFRHDDGTTRIEYFWDQDGRWSTGPWPGLLTTGDYRYGRELTKDTLTPPVLGIDDLMANATHAGAIDEDEVYRVTRHLDFSHSDHKAAAWRISHGAHVMDLASGFDPAEAPLNRPIVCVQLPGRVTADTSGRLLDPYVFEGLMYIFGRADDLAVKYRTGALPVVVNLSYGVIAPHEQTEILVPAIDEAIRARETALQVPHRVTLPSGNAFLSRGHGRFRLGGIGARKRVRWQVQPDDATDSLLEIWLPKVDDPQNPYPYRVELKVRAPTGDESPWMSQGDQWVWQPGGAVRCYVIYQDVVPIWHRNMIRLFLRPTVSNDGSTPVAPSGAWDITIRNAGVPVQILCWIQRDDSPYGYPLRGRQSRFEDPQYLRVDPIDGREVERELMPGSYTKRFGTINRLATGSRTIVLGGFRRSDRTAAKYSAAGPVEVPVNVTRPCRVGPDASAPSDDSHAARGQLAAGSRSGGAVAMAGTSVAAPRIARWIADQMERRLPCDRGDVAQLARTPPNGVPITVPSLPPATASARRWRAGAGGIDIDQPGAPSVVPQVRPRMGIQRRER